MPHTHDKAHFRQCVELLGGPVHLHHASRVNGRRVLDSPSTAQQCFQALLFTCLNSPEREHPWDLMSGRAFSTLRTYFGWISPQPDRLVINTNTAGRVASYLLPYHRVFPDGSFEHSGIPGLRLTGYGPSTITLVHRPTNGRLDLVDSRTQTARGMRDDLLHEHAVVREPDELGEGREPVWITNGLSPSEQAASSAWLPRPITPLLSALMARASLFWQSSPMRTTLRTPRRSNSAARLEWRRGHTAGEIGTLLTGSAVGIPGATFEPGDTEYSRDPASERRPH